MTENLPAYMVPINLMAHGLPGILRQMQPCTTYQYLNGRSVTFKQLSQLSFIPNATFSVIVIVNHTH